MAPRPNQRLIQTPAFIASLGPVAACYRAESFSRPTPKSSSSPHRNPGQCVTRQTPTIANADLPCEQSGLRLSVSEESWQVVREDCDECYEEQRHDHHVGARRLLAHLAFNEASAP